MQVYVQNPPTIRIGGQVSKSLYQYLDAVAGSRGALRGVALAAESARRACEASRGSDQRPPGDQPAGQRRDRSRQGRGARRHRGRDRKRVLQRVRSALGVDDLRARQRIQGAARAGAGVSGRSRGAVAALLQGHAAAEQRRSRDGSSGEWHGRVGARRPQRRRHRRPARYAGESHAGHRPADGEPLRPAAGGDDLVRPCPGGIARRGPEPRAARSPRRCREGVNGSSRALPRRSRARCRISRVLLVIVDHGGLHRARHPLRKLHPPAHDSLRPALGGLRRAADADAVRHGPQHLRASSA